MTLLKATALGFEEGPGNRGGLEIKCYASVSILCCWC